MVTSHEERTRRGGIAEEMRVTDYGLKVSLTEVVILTIQDSNTNGWFRNITTGKM